MRQLDSDHLRTFLAVAEAGSVTGGALRIKRSQSATSLQIKQLEDVVGRPLFHRHGRGVVLTSAGEQLLPVARQMAVALDAALSELRGDRLRGRLRIGMTDAHSPDALARIVADFAARHPEVELEARCALGAGMEEALKTGTLDLAVFEVPEPGRDDEVLREDRLIWMCSGDRDFASARVLPVALFDRDCWWREAALAGIEAAGRHYRIVFTSESAAGVYAAVRAGVAVGLLSTAGETSGLRPAEGMDWPCPSLLVLRKAPDAESDICEAMCDAIRKAF